MRRKIGRLLRANGPEFYSVVRGALSNVLTNVLGSLLSLISSLLIARYFGSSVMGTIAIISAILSMASLFSNFGFSKAILRLIPEYRSRFGDESVFGIYRQTLAIRLFFMALTTLVYFLLLGWIERLYFSTSALPITDILHMSVWVVFFSAFYVFNLHTIRALKQMTAYNLLEVAPRIVLLVLVGCVILWYRYPVDVVYAKLWGDLVSAGVSIALVVWVWKRAGFERTHQTLIAPRKLLSVAFPFFLANALNVIASQTDTLMIGSMLDETSVGIYQVATKLTLLMMFAVQGVGVLAGPIISEMYYAKRIHELAVLMQRISLLLSIVLVPMLMLFVLFGKEILGFFGAEFGAGYVVLVTMALTVVVQGWYALVVLVMGMIGHQGVMSRYLLVSVVLNIALNVLLIPQYGIDGAAFATLIGTMAANALAARYMLQHYGFSVYFLGAKE